jgi:hypothetical protein
LYIIQTAQVRQTSNVGNVEILRISKENIFLITQPLQL